MAEALYLPFDEADGSLVAYDYSPGAHHATVHEGRFVPGRDGNCVYYPGSGYSEVIDQILDLSDTYTLMFWVMTDPQPASTTDTRAVFVFEGDNQEAALYLNTSLSVWTHIAIVHHEGFALAYVNGRKVDTTTFPGGWGSPKGLVIVNHNGRNDAGRCYMSEFKILTDTVYSEGDLIPIITNSTLTVKFSINGLDFKSLGLTVGPNPKGLTDLLGKKESSSYDWPDQHGSQVSLTGRRYTPRQIELDCWYSAYGADAMLDTQMAILSEFKKPGTQRFMVQIATKPWVYEVVNEEGIDFSDVKWRSGKAFCKFTLRMVEYQPIKRVLAYTRVNSSTPAVSITVSTPDLLTIYWGDGGVTYNVTGDNLTVTHTYGSDGTFYPIIAGVIEDITAFSTNAVIVWNEF